MAQVCLSDHGPVSDGMGGRDVQLAGREKTRRSAWRKTDLEDGECAMLGQDMMRYDII